jgi:hypothetical protein
LRRADLVLGLLFGVIGAAVIGLSLAIPSQGLEKSLGPGFFPMWLGGGFVVCGLFQVVGAIFSSKSTSKPVMWPPKDAALRIAGFLGLALFYVASQEILGFLLATLVSLVLMFRLLGARRWVELSTIAVVSSIVAFLVFKLWLGMSLPGGILGF